MLKKLKNRKNTHKKGVYQPLGAAFNWVLSLLQFVHIKKRPTLQLKRLIRHRLMPFNLTVLLIDISVNFKVSHDNNTDQQYSLSV